MYRRRTAIADAVVFPAWKRTLIPSRHSELSGQFEASERRLFGHDGFEDAVERIGAAATGAVSPAGRVRTAGAPLETIARRPESEPVAQAAFP